jgi:hypothetical protein
MKLVNGLPQVVFEGESVLNEIRYAFNEKSRDFWIAAGAAEQIANGVSPFHPSISTEALESLQDWVSQALQDRQAKADPSQQEAF